MSSAPDDPPDRGINPDDEAAMHQGYFRASSLPVMYGRIESPQRRPVTLNRPHLSPALVQSSLQAQQGSGTSSSDDRPLTMSSVSPASSARPSPNVMHRPLASDSEHLPEPSRPRIATQALTSMLQTSMTERPRLYRAGTDPYQARQADPSSSAQISDNRELLQQASFINAEAGPSNPRSHQRYADPDTHWLSEDEGGEHARDVHSHRASSRRRDAQHRAFHRDDRSGDGGDHDKDNNRQEPDKNGLLRPTHTASSTIHRRHMHDGHSSQHSHRITNQPAKAFVLPPMSSLHHPDLAKDSASEQLNLRRIPRRLYASLRCVSCRGFMKDPSTLLCGHSLCLTCCTPGSALSSSKRQQDLHDHKTTVNPTRSNLHRSVAAAPGTSSPHLPVPEIAGQVSQCVAQQAVSPSSATSGPITAHHADGASPMLEISTSTSNTDRIPPLDESANLDLTYQTSQLSASVIDVDAHLRTVLSGHEATLPLRAPSKSSAKIVTGDTICPLPNCRRLTRAKSHGKDGLSVDYVLHKLTELLRVYLLASDISDQAFEQESEYELSGDEEFFDSAESLHHRGQENDGVHLDRQHSRGKAHIEASPRSEAMRAGRHSWDSGDSRTAVQRQASQDLDSPSPLSSVSSIEETPKGEEAMKRTIGGRNRMSKNTKRPKTDSSSMTRRPATAPVPGSIKPTQEGNVISSDITANLRLQTLIADVLSELECQVCVTLIHEPITTTCGHTFCKRCLFRSLDHSSKCPLCRTQLPGFNFFLTAPLNQTLSSLIQTTFPQMYAERQSLLKQEEDEVGLDTPMFVCMIAFPCMPTNLHIYEPRYRLMMRRAMDTNRRFGMVLPSRAHGGFSQYGTMLEIQNFHMFDDGRSVVETIGVHRFKVLESGSMDGYNVARIERIEDIDDEQEEELENLALARNAVRKAQQAQQDAATIASSITGRRPSFTRNSSSSPRSAQRLPLPGGLTLPSGNHVPPTNIDAPDGDSTDAALELSNKELVDVCKGFVDALRTGSTPWLLQRLNNSLPAMPDDPREFTWWMAMLMPIDDHEKARLLQITSYRLRLRLLVFWIQQMQHSWWFTRGCTIA